MAKKILLVEDDPVPIPRFDRDAMGREVVVLSISNLIILIL